MAADYEALLIVGFGGPEGPHDVVPFLENVTRGRNIPRERLLEVAEHYQRFGGVSPINAQVRELIDLLQPALRESGIDLPVYWGNRNWRPMLADTVGEMTKHGIRRALAFVLAAYGSYSSCRQYLENIDAARTMTGNRAPQIDKIRLFFNHPDFIAANADRLQSAIGRFAPAQQSGVHVAFTAHSIPSGMAAGSPYQLQLLETCRLVAQACGVSTDRWRLVFQSRSGRPSDPWLEPDILDHLRTLHEATVQDAVVMPVGFLSDHIEVLYDLDCEAAELAGQLGMTMVRAPSVGAHPRFVSMIVELVRERLHGGTLRRSVGELPIAADQCPAGCCPPPVRRSN